MTALAILCSAEGCTDFELLQSVHKCDHMLLNMPSGRSQAVPFEYALPNHRYTAYLLLCLGLEDDERVRETAIRHKFRLDIALAFASTSQLLSLEETCLFLK